VETPASIDKALTELKGEILKSAQVAIKEAYDLGCFEERARIAQIIEPLFFSVMRHPAHRKSAMVDILKSVGSAIRKGQAGSVELVPVQGKLPDGSWGVIRYVLETEL
jgi:hypothetical protein